MPNRRGFRIHLMNQPYLAIRAAQLEPGEAPISAARAWNLVERELHHARDLSGLAVLWRAIAQNGAYSPGSIRLQPMKQAFQSGTWVLLPLAAPRGPLNVSTSESASQAAKSATLAKTWIEMEVVDDLDQPMSGLRYICMLPDGTMEEGTLDAKGRIRFDGIDPGNCVFKLPDLDREMWRKL